MDYIIIFVFLAPEVLSMVIFTIMMTYETFFPKEDTPHDEYHHNQ